MLNGGCTYGIVKFVVHEKHDDDLKFADIALMKTGEDIRFDDTVQPIPMATSDQILSKAVVSGWGYTTTDNWNYAKTLQFVEVDVLSNEECLKKLENHKCEPMECHEMIHPSTVCTLSPSGGVFGGDSGGPLVADGHLVGVVAWGFSKTQGLPDGFMRVSEFSDWINQKMNES